MGLYETRHAQRAFFMPTTQLSIFVENRNKMKKILFLLFIFISVCSYAQKNGVYDVNIHATDSLEIDANFMVSNDTIVPILDVSYFEFSSDGVTFSKDYTVNDTWMRVSNYAKTSWDTIRIQPLLWELSGDSLKPAGDYLIAGDSIFGGEINTNLFLLNGDSLTYENLPTGGGIIGYVATNNGDGTASWQPIPSGNGAYGRNVGLSGIGVYSDTIGSELQFKNIAVGDNLSISESDSVITIDYDGSSVIVTAGTGLSGGGALSSSITINLYIPELAELTSLSYLDKGNDFVPIYDNSAAQHKKIKPVYFHPDIFVNDIKEEEAPPFFNFIAGSNVTITSDGNGGVIISADATASLPTCAEGEFLAYVGGEWTCVNVCDYICADTIIDIVNNYNDTVPSVIEPNGDVQINFSRLDCEDSTQILASQLATSTLNLTTIKITSIPTVGELHYNGVAVIANQELSVTLGSLDNALYYVSDASTGSAYIDGFDFQLLYSSNTSYLGTASVNVSVDACVTESVCFGYLYNWYAVGDSRGITNNGWHVPSQTETETLQTYLGGLSVAGGKLKETGLTRWDSPNAGATNEVGFNGVGAGTRSGVSGVFVSIDELCYITTTRYFEFDGIPRTTKFKLSYVDANFQDQSLVAQTGGTVRLVKDATTLSHGETGTYTGNDGKVYQTICIGTQEWLAENLEETKYRNGDYIQGYDGGTYTPIDNATWAGLTTGALCVYGDNLNYACKDLGAAVTEYCYKGLYSCGDPAHVIAGHEPKTGSVTYTDAYGATITEYYCLDDGDITIYSSTTPVLDGMTICVP